MDYFLAQLIARMSEFLLVMQAHCGNQTSAMLCSSGAPEISDAIHCSDQPTAMLCTSGSVTSQVPLQICRGTTASAFADGFADIISPRNNGKFFRHTLACRF